MDIEYLKLKKIFTKANKIFLERDISLLVDKVSERTLCGALMLTLYDILKKSEYSSYFVDVEYNRNKGKLKTICNKETAIIKINCDLIVHSRGKNLKQDNLIAIEMKKKERPRQEKEDDRERLVCLTKNSFDNIWSCDGRSLPEHICRYKMGIFYEIDLEGISLDLEYYYEGKKVELEKINISKSRKNEMLIEKLECI